MALACHFPACFHNIVLIITATDFFHHHLCSSGCFKMSSSATASTSATLGTNALPRPDYLQGKGYDDKKNRIAIGALRIYENGRFSTQPCRLVCIFCVKSLYSTFRLGCIYHDRHTESHSCSSVSATTKIALSILEHQVDVRGARISQ